MSALPLARAHQLCAPLIPPCLSPPPYLRSAPLPPLSAIPASPLCRRRTPLAPLRGAARRRAIALRAQAAAGGDEGKESRGGAGGERSSGGVKRVVILGGSGRVGRSTAVALAALAASDDEATRAEFQLELIISGRNRRGRGRGEAVCEEVRAAAGAAGRATFIECDITDASALDALLTGADLVVHCAGPFQQEPNCTVLEAAIRTKVGFLTSQTSSSSLHFHALHRPPHAMQQCSLALSITRPTPNVDVCSDVAFAGNARERRFDVPPFLPSPHSPNNPPPPQTPYVDVCDDVAYAGNARSLHGAAVAAGVPAITTAGIYPGVSNLMAAELVRLTGEEGARMEEQQGQQQAALGLRPKSLRFSYFTAGTGGTGPTILTTSLLLLGEPATAFKDGQRLQLPAYSRQRLVDFGPGVGERSTYLLSLPSSLPLLSHSLPTPLPHLSRSSPAPPLLPPPPPSNLPEVVSAHEVLGVPTVSARFGTAPHMWNWGMQLLHALLPQAVLQDRRAVQRMVGALGPLAVLQDRSAVQRMAGALEPLVRAADGTAGERVAMRVDLETENGRSTMALFSHRRLSVSVGVATAAFAAALLEGTSLPGVHYPEQAEAIPVAQREKLLQRATLGARFFAINKPGWMIEREPKQIGMGMYV
ncbi:unnamed protein product [Closterium sp. Naga37s-1]|nr:unnamed protein product [Closterium sp. Naga37s-1]